MDDGNPCEASGSAGAAAAQWGLRAWLDSSGLVGNGILGKEGSSWTVCGTVDWSHTGELSKEVKVLKVDEKIEAHGD